MQHFGLAGPYGAWFGRNVTFRFSSDHALCLWMRAARYAVLGTQTPGEPQVSQNDLLHNLCWDPSRKIMCHLTVISLEEQYSNLSFALSRSQAIAGFSIISDCLPYLSWMENAEKTISYTTRSEPRFFLNHWTSSGAGCAVVGWQCIIGLFLTADGIWSNFDHQILSWIQKSI